MKKKAGIEYFREQCRREFRFLEEEYGFTERKLPKEEFVNVFQVQYVNATTFVAVKGIHWGFGIDVRIGRVEPEAWETWKHYALEDLLQIRCPELLLPEPIVRDQAFQLKHYAPALKKCADDILRGQFSILPQLHQAIEERARQFSGGEA